LRDLLHKRLALLFCAFVSISLSACSSDTDPSTVTAKQLVVTADVRASASEVVEMSARQTQLWAASCALCHVDGNAGAPRVGHADEWRDRVSQGDDVLLVHTLDGFKQMPPLGYCMACERSDFVAMINFMSATL